MNDALEKMIKEYLALVKDVTEKRPDVKFALTQITLRPLHQWYMDCHDAFCKELGEGVRMMDFTPSSGKVFVNPILYNADAFFNTEVVELNEEMEVSTTEEERDDSNSKTKIGRRITLVEREVANLKEEIIRRREDDCLVTARIREELDFLSNIKRGQNSHYKFNEQGPQSSRVGRKEKVD
jgi:hypothetical protein